MENQDYTVDGAYKDRDKARSVRQILQQVRLEALTEEERADHTGADQGKRVDQQ